MEVKENIQFSHNSLTCKARVIWKNPIFECQNLDLLLAFLCNTFDLNNFQTISITSIPLATKNVLSNTHSLRLTMKLHLPKIQRPSPFHNPSALYYNGDNTNTEENALSAMQLISFNSHSNPMLPVLFLKMSLKYS